MTETTPQIYTPQLPSLLSKLTYADLGEVGDANPVVNLTITDGLYSSWQLGYVDEETSKPVFYKEILTKPQRIPPSYNPKRIITEELDSLGGQSEGLVILLKKDIFQLPTYRAKFHINGNGVEIIRA